MVKDIHNLFTETEKALSDITEKYLPDILYKEVDAVYRGLIKYSPRPDNSEGFSTGNFRLSWRVSLDSPEYCTKNYNNKLSNSTWTVNNPPTDERPTNNERMTSGINKMKSLILNKCSNGANNITVFFTNNAIDKSSDNVYSEVVEFEHGYAPIAKTISNFNLLVRE